MTRLLKQLTKSFIFTCLFFLLVSETLAQMPDDVGSDTESVATTTITDTLLLSEEEGDEAKELWYRLETISGNVEVGDFVVGPGKSEIEVNPGETVIQEISVTNRISDGRIFSLEIEDIAGSKDGSASVSLTGQNRGPYSVRDYLSFPENNFELDLGERARIPVKITVPPDAEPGGYYGSVLVSTVQSTGQEADTAPRSPIIARVGSLFFVTVKGEMVRDGKVLELSLLNDKWWYEKGPIDFGILMENTGSVHLNPYGEISISNMFGEQVGFVELEPWFVLPDSLRVREISWDREFLLGRYVVTAKINRGYDDVVDEVSVSFWVLPWKIVGGIFLILFIIIFSVRAFFRAFEFKRKSP
jgi:hypothetical protein